MLFPGPWIEQVGAYVDVFGVIVVVASILYSTIRFFLNLKSLNGFKSYRQNLGRGILLGLEILVAGDIIRTVGVAPTMQSVLVLAVIVAIRTFLSWSLEVELEGRWPWTKAETGTTS